MRILLVEDTPRLAEYVARGLRENGHLVDTAHDGLRGRDLALDAQYDLMLLDVMLPGLDGFGVLDAIRRDGCRTAVLMLTARDAVEDRVRGLRAGADDYLLKPFSFAELLARIEAIGRRGRREAESDAVGPLRLADLRLDLIRRRATRAGRPLELTGKEFTLLTLLLRRCGEVQSRSVLAEQVWDMHFDGDTNVVEVAVRRLRAKLDDPYEHKLLHTVRGAGYVLEDRSA
jgi:two-component system copper resistance phosphate regulon response regulator CusR